jgi:hypothetical protein
MLLVMQVLAQLLVRSTVLVCRRRWSPLTVALVLMVLHLMNRVVIRCLMGDSLHRTRECQVIQPQGMAFLCGRCVQVRANGPHIE